MVSEMCAVLEQTRQTMLRPQNFWLGATCPSTRQPRPSVWNASTGGWCETFSETNLKPVETGPTDRFQQIQEGSEPHLYLVGCTRRSRREVGCWRSD